jgi:hypothetical protein
MGDVNSARRFYLLSAQWLEGDIDQESLKQVWWGKQEGQPGTPFPADFPFQADLVAIHYKALEDLNGADQEELINQGLPYFKAKAVLEAFAEI